MSLQRISAKLAKSGKKHRVVTASAGTYNAKGFVNSLSSELVGADVLKYCVSTRVTAIQSASEAIVTGFRTVFLSWFKASSFDFEVFVSVARDVLSAKVTLQVSNKELSERIGLKQASFSLVISDSGHIQKVKASGKTATATASSERRWVAKGPKGRVTKPTAKEALEAYKTEFGSRGALTLSENEVEGDMLVFRQGCKMFKGTFAELLKHAATATANDDALEVKVHVTDVDSHTRMRLLLAASYAYDAHRSWGAMYGQDRDPKDAVFSVSSWSDKPEESVSEILTTFFKTFITDAKKIAELIRSGIRNGKIMLTLTPKQEQALASAKLSDNISTAAVANNYKFFNSASLLSVYAMLTSISLPASVNALSKLCVTDAESAKVKLAQLKTGIKSACAVLNRADSVTKQAFGLNGMSALLNGDMQGLTEVLSGEFDAADAQHVLAGFAKNIKELLGMVRKIDKELKRRGVKFTSAFASVASEVTAADDFKIVCKTKLPTADVGILDQIEDGRLRGRGSFEDITVTKLVNSYKKAIRNTITPVKHMFNGIDSKQKPGQNTRLLVRKFGSKMGDKDITNVLYDVQLLNAEHKPVYRVEDITPVMELKITEIRRAGSETTASELPSHRRVRIPGKRAQAGIDVADVRRVSNNKLVRSVRDEISNDKLNNHAGDFIKELLRIASEEQALTGEACYIYWRGTKYFPDFKTQTLKSGGSAQRRFANSY